jgi:hypothetical protein
MYLRYLKNVYEMRKDMSLIHEEEKIRSSEGKSILGRPKL